MGRLHFFVAAYCQDSRPLRQCVLHELWPMQSHAYDIPDRLPNQDACNLGGQGSAIGQTIAPAGPTVVSDTVDTNPA